MPVRAAEELTPWRIAIAIVSLVVMIMLAVDMFMEVPEELSRLIWGVDLVVCGILFLDFLIGFSRAESKMEYMRWGWINLLSAIPAIEQLRFMRILLIARMIRAIRVLRSTYLVYTLLRAAGKPTTLPSLGLLAAVVVMTGGFLILAVETAPDSNIRTAEEAVWWSFVTVTTVGYGDFYPVTTAGRILASFLMLFGIGIFGAYTALVANIVLQGRVREFEEQREEEESARD